MKRSLVPTDQINQETKYFRIKQDNKKDAKKSDKV